MEGPLKRDNFFKTLLTLFALFLIATDLSYAQSDTARIEGIVSDATGAVVAGASLKVTNVDTNISLTTVTNENGKYVLTPLRVGKYELEITAPNFRKHVQTNIELQVNQVARIDIHLEVGNVSEEVQVIGGTPLIESSTSSLGQVINGGQIEDLPLNGRNFTQLATLVPGVTRGTPGSNADGSGGHAETFRLGETGSAAISANGLREQNNNFQLDGIDNNESIVNTIVFFPPIEALEEFRVITNVAPAEFGRGGGAIINAVIKSGSNNFHGSLFEFHRNSALDARPTFARDKPLFIRNQFGFTFGGPIVKDRTFFFGDYQGLRQRLPIEAGDRITVPTLKMRQGDFSELLNPQFTGHDRAIQIYDPINGNPFPGNIIPTNRLNAVGLGYLNLFPLPHLTDRAQRNYYVDRLRRQNFNDGDVRIDHHFTEKDTIFGRFSIADDVQTDPGRIPGYQAGFGAGTNQVKARSLALNYTRTFTPSLINESRFGYIGQRVEFLPVGYGIDQNKALGIPGTGGISKPNGISLIGGGNGQYIEYLGDYGEYTLNERTLQFSDAVTYTNGNHTFKFGGTVIQRHIRSLQADAAKGFYYFSADLVDPGKVPSPGRTGYEVSDILIGKTDFTATSQPAIDPFTTINYENGFYAQDDWRASQRLTLNLGLRYDLYTPYYEINNRMANYDPTTSTILLAGQNGNSRSIVARDNNNFGPRIGFAYALTKDNRTVLRGGYGLFYSLDRGGISNQLTQNPPFIVTQYRFSGDKDPGSQISLSEPIPLPDPIDINSPALPKGSSLRYYPRDNRNTQVHQFNLTVERELTSVLALHMAYVGTRGENVTAVVSKGGFSDPNIKDRLTTIANLASSKYDSLQVKMNLRPWHGLSYLTSYTFGKAINDSPGPFPGPGGNFKNTPTDPNNLLLDRGLADYDVKHRFTFAGTYDIQLFRGLTGLPRHILNGWQINSIVTLQSGTPFSVFDDDGRAALIGNPHLKNPTTNRFFNIAAFEATKTNPSGRNILRGPKYTNIDASVFRRFTLRERTQLEFRAEAFNLFNTPHYNLPVITGFGGDFGRIISTRNNSERQIQLGLRLTF
jgi:hypothetical protein